MSAISKLTGAVRAGGAFAGAWAGVVGEGGDWPKATPARDTSKAMWAKVRMLTATSSQPLELDCNDRSGRDGNGEDFPRSKESTLASVETRYK